MMIGIFIICIVAMGVYWWWRGARRQHREAGDYATRRHQRAPEINENEFDLADNQAAVSSVKAKPESTLHPKPNSKPHIEPSLHAVTVKQAQVKPKKVIIDDSVDQDAGEIAQKEQDSTTVEPEAVREPQIQTGIQNKTKENPTKENKTRPVVESNAKAKTTRKHGKILCVSAIAAKDKPYAGYELLQSLLSQGLRFGKHNVFHRHEKKNGIGEILFSVTSVNKPGTFDLAAMGGYSCPGLSMFLQVGTTANDLQSLDTLLETAEAIANDLGGHLQDGSRQPLTDDAIAAMRTDIHQYEANAKNTDMFAE